MVLNRGSHTTCLNGHKGNKDGTVYKAQGGQVDATGAAFPYFVFLPSGVLFGVTKPAIRLIGYISCHHESIGD